MAERTERAVIGGRFELKKAGAESKDGTFTGYGALFNTLCPTSSWSLPYDFQDKFRPGAFAAAIAERQKNGGRFPACWQHDSDCPIGSYPEIKEDETGLYVEGKLTLETMKGSECYALMRDQAISGLSVGYIPRAWEIDQDKKVRELIDVKLLEISPVTFPNMDGARVADVKSLDGVTDPSERKRIIERALREVGLSRSEAKAAVAAIFKDALRDAAADDVAASLHRLAASIHP
jgi:Escherichia/Staphylococcus phage prohead protease